jgi:hypothetical protein
MRKTVSLVSMSRLATGYKNYCRELFRLVNKKSCNYDFAMSKQMAELLRAKIVESGVSANRLAEITDVKQQTISEFLRGAGISLSTAQKLADHFGLVLTDNQRSARKRRS